MRVVRDIAAPPEAVFDAWTDPASLRIWMAPDPATVGAADCDARIGGAFRIVMIDASGSIEHAGTYGRSAGQAGWRSRGVPAIWARPSPAWSSP